MLTSLTILGESDIGDISALSLAPNLRELSFLDSTENLDDSEFSVLADLPKLEVLRITTAPSSDFPAFLAPLTKLTSLSLNAEYFTDLSFIRHLAALTSLELKWANEVTDFSVFRHLTSLTHLQLRGAKKFSDISLLESLCPQLVTLNISNTAVSDLSPLLYGFCPNLVDLDVSGTGISDTSPLVQFSPKLRHLDISGTRVTDLSPLAALSPGLESLTVNRWLKSPQQVVVFSGQLGNLRGISLRDCEISDFSFLVPYKSTLEELDLSCCSGLEVQSLQLLREFKALRSLYMGVIPDLVDVQFLEELKELVELDLSGTQALNISAISALKKLRTLSISARGIEDLTAVGELTTLEDLSLYSDINGSLNSLEPLEKLVHLRHLSLNGNVKLRDLSSLVGFVLLESLDVSDAEVDDVRLLVRFPNLKRLYIPERYPEGRKVLEVLQKLDFAGVYASESSASGKDFRQFLFDYLDEEMPYYEDEDA